MEKKRKQRVYVSYANDVSLNKKNSNKTIWKEYECPFT